MSHIVISQAWVRRKDSSHWPQATINKIIHAQRQISKDYRFSVLDKIETAEFENLPKKI